MIITYKGKAPTIKQIVKKSGLKPQRILYLTATARLQSVRQIELSTLNEKINPVDQEKTHTLFRKVFSSVLNDQGIEVLTRSAERIFFRRSINRAYQGLPPKELEAKREQIIADERRWIEAFERICASKHLCIAQDPIDTLPFITDRLRDSCRVLWHAFADERKDAQKRAERYEFFPEVLLDRALQFTSQDVELIIFEGFTFFTPLQVAFIRKLQQQQHIQLQFVINYDPATHAAYQSVADAYQHVLGEDITCEAFMFPTSELEQNPILTEVRGQLFEPNVQTVSQPQGQQAISFSWHALQNDEARACVDWINLHRPDILLPASEASAAHQTQPLTKLVIISRDVQEAKLAIEMECVRRGVKSPFRQERFSLLHLPIGRFLMLAYQVMSTGEFRCDPESFAMVVDSGLLKAQVGERNHLVYQRLTPLYFENCRTETEWDRSFQALINGTQPKPLDSQPSTAVSVVDQTKRQELYDLYLQFKGLAQALFTSQEGAVNDHVERLKVYLEQYLTPGLAQAGLAQATTNDREVIQDIQSILDQLPDEVQVTSDEFHDLLMGYLQDEQEDEEVNDVHLSLVGPESAEGTQVDHVWVFGAQQATFPRRYDYPWPFDDLSIDDHLHRERNFWMAVLRHPRETLTLSVTHLYDEEARIFSPYVNEVAHRMGLALEKPKVILQEVLNDPSYVYIPSTSTTYHLVEIARYRLCPFAYYALKNDHLSKTGADNFQVSWRAQTLWLEYALNELTKLGNLKDILGRKSNIEAFLKKAFKLICAKVNPLFDQALPGMSGQVSSDVKQRGMHILKDIFFSKEHSILRILNKRHCVSINIVEIPESYKQVNNQAILIPKHYAVTQDGSIGFIVYMYNISANFGIYPNKADMPKKHAVMEWFTQALRDPTTLQPEIDSVIKSIDKGYFPKKPGRHCAYCPARSICQSDGELREEHD